MIMEFKSRSTKPYKKKQGTHSFSPRVFIKMLDTVRILRVSKQTPFRVITPPRYVKLTFFDLHWYFAAPAQIVLFFKTRTHFPTLVDKVKEALTLALQDFYPLPGKFIYSPESDDLVIQCSNEDDGVEFIEAESDADFHQLVDASVHNVNTYRKLVPSIDISEFPAPLLSVQVTGFVAGGICLGITWHHMAMDGRSLCHFIKSWAEICRSGDLLVQPCYDRQLIQDDGASDFFLDMFRPSLPKLKILHQQSHEIAKRTFVLTAADIQSLKERATKQQSEPSLGRISTFMAITAHTWVCSVRARQVPGEDITTLIFAADCRSRLDPPVVQEYFGNCVKPCFVKAKGFELQGEQGTGYAVRAIQEVARASLEAPLNDMSSWSWKSISGTMMNVALSPNFRVYDTDFGWGRPSRVELASMDEGNIVLVENKDEEGGIQVSIGLAPPHMEEFAKFFFNGLDGGD